jgi:hypothetical protein
MWHVDMLLGNDPEISNYNGRYLAAARKQKQRNGVFYAISAERTVNEGQLVESRHLGAMG